MRSAIFGFVVALTAFSAHAAPTAMNLVEKSSYRLTSLVQKGTIPSYMSTDLAEVQINPVILLDGTKGTNISLLSASNNSAEPNSVTLSFSADGKIVNVVTHVVGQGNPTPIFKDGAKLLDLAAEAVVDHLSEDKNLPIVASTAKNIEVQKQGGALFSILLADGRIYKILLNDNGDLISKGF